MHHHWILVVPFVLGACGVDDGAAGQPDASADAVIDTAGIDAAPTAPPLPEALDCGVFNPSPGGADLQRFDLDAFPEARCNDGTVAVFYFRPGATAAGRDNWLIELQGGGACASPSTCAARWCSIDQQFSATAMSSRNQPAAWKADGITRRAGPAGEVNPFADWNHVFVHYCSSDTWDGQRPPIAVDAVHPVTGAPVRYQIEFRGAAIFDAAIATLRREGVAVPAYTLGGGATELPDLDSAAQVVLAGASAGGAGVIANADRLAARLRATNPTLRFGAIADSITGPDKGLLDYAPSMPCTLAGWCSYQAHMENHPGPVFQLSRGEDTCASWHAAHAPATAWKCNDSLHAIDHHVTSALVVRMGMRDALISNEYIGAMYGVPGAGPLDLARFAELVAAQRAAMPTLVSEEPRARPPAVFVPNCPKHETLDDDAAFYGVTVRSLSFVDILVNAATGGTPANAVWAPGDPIDCQ